MDEFDSGDDLFDDVDPEQLMEESGPTSKRPLSSAGDGIGVHGSKKLRLDESDSAQVALAHKILREKFRLEQFRHEQEKAITAILKGENSLVIFPTGAGKSLCYQVPAVAFEELDKEAGGRSEEGSGITIVVSPLIALMKDQTDALKRRGIAAESSDSTKTWEQQQDTALKMRQGKLKLLYCAPERLNNEGFVQQMKHVPGGVRLVAVDEAHCISEWGHSFRPDYLKVARFVEEIRAERVICLTATATPRVAEDVCKAFNVAPSNVFRTSPYRPNLQLQAETTKSKEEKFPKLCTFLKKHSGSTLVYVTQQKQAEELANKLRAQKFDATAFHAGMKSEEKAKIQDEFMASKIRIVVATIAFGMGIDKADIRNVVHWDLSSTVEEYSQQIGRAGRDGLPSHCMLYVCNDDFYIKENFARGDLPSKQSLVGLLQDVFCRESSREYGEEILKLGMYELSRDYDIRPSPLSIILATLELRFGFLRAITPEYTGYQWEDRGRYNSVTRGDASAVAQAIVSQAKKAKKFYHFDMKAAMSTTGLPRTDFVRKLDQWHNEGVIFLKTSGIQHRYRVLKKLPQSKPEIGEIADKLFVDMEAREEDALQRTRQVTDLVTANKCFALSLAQHFGMGLPEDKASCGHCTFCTTQLPIVLPPKPVPTVNFSAIKKVLEVCSVRDDPRFLTRVAFGIKSPRVTQLKLDKSTVFGSLEDHDFKSLLNEFTNACKEANFQTK